MKQWIKSSIAVPKNNKEVKIQYRDRSGKIVEEGNGKYLENVNQWKLNYNSRNSIIESIERIKLSNAELYWLDEQIELENSSRFDLEMVILETLDSIKQIISDKHIGCNGVTFNEFIKAYKLVKSKCNNECNKLVESETSGICQFYGICMKDISYITEYELEQLEYKIKQLLE